MTIYDQHDKAFARVSAYVVLKGDWRCATIAFKFPRDGAGRLYAYVHWLGVHMVRGHANGYGYDKKSAAVESAVPRIAKADALNENLAYSEANRLTFVAALKDCGGLDWERKLREAGFTVWQAV